MTDQATQTMTDQATQTNEISSIETDLRNIITRTQLNRIRSNQYIGLRRPSSGPFVSIPFISTPYVPMPPYVPPLLPYVSIPPRPYPRTDPFPNPSRAELDLISLKARLDKDYCINLEKDREDLEEQLSKVNEKLKKYKK